MSKKALIVWGGWDGHEPQQIAEIFRTTLLDMGFDVEVSEEILDFIAIHFDECLCNDCMEELKNELVFIK